MAVQRLNISVASLDFGGVEPGSTQSQTITFSNQSSPTVSIDVTITGIASPFSVGVGEDSFTLAANGDSQDVVVTYAPTVAQVDDVTWSIAHDAPTPDTPIAFTITAECLADATAYPLPDIDALVGTFKVTVYSEYAGLTAPTAPTVITIGRLEEQMLLYPGASQLSTLDIEVMDDYETLTAGFWYKVLQGRTTIKVILAENGTDTLYYLGVPEKTSIVWTEHYLSGGAYRRSARVTLVSVAVNMFDSPAQSWVEEAYANRITGNTADIEPSHVISLRGMFAALLKSSGLNATYDESDVSVVQNESLMSIKWKDENQDFRTLDELYICTNWTDSGGPYTDNVVEYFDSTHGYYLGRIYPQAGQMAIDILRNIGCVLRMDYDTATDRHKIQLIQIRNAYSTLVTLGTPIESRIENATDLIGDSVRVISKAEPTELAWLSKKYQQTPTSTAPPDYVQFDVDYAILFGEPGMGAGDSALMKSQFWASATGAADSFVEVTSLEWRRFSDDTYQPPPATYWPQGAVASLNYYQFTENYARFTRRYGEFGATSGGVLSHTNIGLGRRTEINDGISTRTFFAQRVAKDAERGEVEVEWIEE
jgi:hypothetical protein